MTSVFELQRIVIDFQDPDAFQQETCTICLETFHRDTLQYSTPPVTLDCDHFTCTDCLHAYMADHLSKDHRNIKSFELHCPSVRDGGAGCSEVYTELDFLGVGRRVGHQLWLKRKTLASVRSRHYCANPRCAMVILPEGSNPEEMIDLPCSACEARNCLICKTLMHPGLTCEVNSFRSASENDRSFQAIVALSGFQECSQCGATVERTEGCRTMRCLCGHMFCYRCGEPDNYRHICLGPRTPRTRVQELPTRPEVSKFEEYCVLFIYTLIVVCIMYALYSIGSVLDLKKFFDQMKAT